jgi:outer membrane lipoprotein SlyB
MPGGGLRTALTALGGSVVGGLVGTGIERATGDTTAYEYIVRKASSELVSVTQKDTLPLELGQKVLVIAGGQARIVPDYTVPPPAVALVEPVFSTPLASPAVPGLLPVSPEKEPGGQPVDPR